MTDEDFDKYEISEDNPEVRLGYSSHTNISFGGTIATGYSRTEWDSFSEKQQTDIMDESLWELVEVFQLEDGDRDYSPGYHPFR